MDQVCINNSTEIAGVVAGVVTLVSGVVNFVPTPDKISNPILRFISRALHFVALDVVTANQPK